MDRHTTFSHLISRMCLCIIHLILRFISLNIVVWILYWWFLLTENSMCRGRKWIQEIWDGVRCRCNKRVRNYFLIVKSYFLVARWLLVSLRRWKRVQKNMIFSKMSQGQIPLVVSNMCVVNRWSCIMCEYLS